MRKIGLTAGTLALMAAYSFAGHVSITTQPSAGDSLVVVGPGTYVTFTANASVDNGAIDNYNWMSDGGEVIGDTTSSSIVIYYDSDYAGQDQYVSIGIDHSSTDKNGQPISCQDDSTPITTTTVDVVSLTLKSVDLLGTGQQDMLNITDTYADSDGQQIPHPQWTDDETDPVCYVKGSKPHLSATFDVSPSVSGSTTVAVKGLFNQSSTSLTYSQQTASLSGDTVTVDLTTDNALSNAVFNGQFQGALQFFINPAEDWSDVSGGTVGGPLLCTYGSSTGAMSLKRLQELCSVANEKESHDDVVSQIAYLAVTQAFNPNNPLAGSGNDSDAVWQLLDGDGSDCVSQSALGYQALNLMGVGSGSVVYVYPRSGSWANLRQTSPTGSQTDFAYSAKTQNTITYTLYYFTQFDGSAVPNSWEGCLRTTMASGSPIYWEGGGGGQSETTAEQVLFDSAGPRGNNTQMFYNVPNEDPLGGQVAWVPYPDGDPSPND